MCKICTSLTTFEFPHPSPSPHNVWNSFLWSNVPVGVCQFFQLNSTKMPLFELTSLEYCFCRQVIHVIIRVHLTNNLIRPYCVTFETTELKLSMKKETYKNQGTATCYNGTKQTFIILYFHLLWKECFPIMQVSAGLQLSPAHIWENMIYILSK